MSSSTTLDALRKQAVNANVQPRPLIVTKSNWSKGYCVFIRENVNGRFKGHSFLNGNLCSLDVSFAETEPGFYEYKGPDRDRIILIERKMAIDALPEISDAPKAFGPKYGEATAIKKRLAEQHKEDGDPTLS